MKVRGAALHLRKEIKHTRNRARGTHLQIQVLNHLKKKKKKLVKPQFNKKVVSDSEKKKKPTLK